MWIWWQGCGTRWIAASTHWATSSGDLGIRFKAMKAVVGRDIHSRRRQISKDS